MCWLHGLLHHRYQVLTQACQIYLIAQSGTEGFQCLRSVVLAAVETAVDDPLNTTAEGLQGENFSTMRVWFVRI
jgi:hypothetical protein